MKNRGLALLEPLKSRDVPLLSFGSSAGRAKTFEGSSPFNGLPAIGTAPKAEQWHVSRDSDA